jgi:MOSC domain-containing protein YiiM
VASIHLHPGVPDLAMLPVESAQLIADKGILGDLRYFEKLNRKTGQPSTSNVSIIEREQINSHALALSMDRIPPGTVRSNIETDGIDLSLLIGREVQIGTASLIIHSHREPCAKMDKIKPGLRELMKNGRQGVLAKVVRSGTICVGDAIHPGGSWDS